MILADIWYLHLSRRSGETDLYIRLLIFSFFFTYAIGTGDRPFFSAKLTGEKQSMINPWYVAIRFGCIPFPFFLSDESNYGCSSKTRDFRERKKPHVDDSVAFLLTFPKCSSPFTYIHSADSFFFVYKHDWARGPKERRVHSNRSSKGTGSSCIMWTSDRISSYRYYILHSWPIDNPNIIFLDYLIILFGLSKPFW